MPNTHAIIVSNYESNIKKAKFTAKDQSGEVTITAKHGSCACLIKFTIVTPTRFVLKRPAGTPIIHHNGVPDCGWKGRAYIEPTGVNFYKIYIRERDSQATGTGAYVVLNGAWHGKYNPADLANGTSQWFQLNMTEYNNSFGSALAPHILDTIFAGVGAEAGVSPPFTESLLAMPIDWGWSLTNSNVDIYSFPTETQKHEIFTDEKCKTSKAGHSETTNYTDPDSGLH